MSRLELLVTSGVRMCSCGPPASYMKVDRSPDGHFADLNMNSGGTEVCLCYKKEVRSIQTEGESVVTEL